jgi:hypothetical protein
MAYGEIERMRQEGDLEGLFGVFEDEDQYARRIATEAICTFCNEKVAEKLAQLKFKDTDQRVRDTAARGHAQVVAAMKARESL